MMRALDEETSKLEDEKRHRAKESTNVFYKLRESSNTEDNAPFLSDGESAELLTVLAESVRARHSDTLLRRLHIDFLWREGNKEGRHIVQHGPVFLLMHSSRYHIRFIQISLLTPITPERLDS